MEGDWRSLTFHVIVAIAQEHTVRGDRFIKEISDAPTHLLQPKYIFLKKSG
jgi:hypothetical protein